jgi:hypothetical protein
MSEDCGVHFVASGGMRLLKRWLKVAEEENCVDELTMIIAALMKLPFNEKVVKDTEIGKVIKRLLKYKGSTDGGPSQASAVAKLHKEVKSVMEHWTSQVQSKANMPSSPRTKSAMATTSSVDPGTVRLMQEVSRFVKAPEVAVVVSSPREPSSPKSPTQVSHTRSADFTDAGRKKENNVTADLIGSVLGAPAFKSETKNSSASTVPANSLAARLASAQQTKMAAQAAAAAAAPVLAPAPSVKPPIKVHRDKERRLEDMAAGAKKYLSVHKGDVGAGGSNLNSTTDPKKEANLAGYSVSTGVPSLKSAIKRKSQDISGDTAIVAEGPESDMSQTVKRPKLSVKWVDQCNAGSLRQVFTFEVEKIKNSVANYKTHKDLVKKEKQLEKDTISHKIRDAMQPVGEWIR